MQHFFMQNKIITNVKQGNIKQGVTTTAGSITKGLQRHQFFERRIKPINNDMYECNETVQHGGRKNKERKPVSS
jgi:hypothetical protein